LSCHRYSIDEVRALFTRSPFMATLGVRVVAIAPGEVSTMLEVQARHHQQDGFAHAGVLATLADHTAGAAAATLADARCQVLTAEFKLNLLRPAAGTPLRCTARVLKPGRLLTVAESELLCGDGGALCAKATVTLAMLPGAGDRP